MQQRKKFTDEAISQIRGWAKDDVSVDEIVRRIGCTLGTLRVRCSQLGIRLRRRTPANEKSKVPSRPKGRPAFGHMRRRAAPEYEQITVVLPLVTFEQLRARASLKGTTTAVLAATLLEIIARDDLYEAVLDESRGEARQKVRRNLDAR